MEPRIVEKGAFTLVGMIYWGRNQDSEIGRLWTEFNQRAGQIPHRRNEGAYGFCFGVQKGNPTFWYMSAVPVDRIGEIPSEMVAKTVPAQTYAVFTHCGPAATVIQTYDYAYGTWLPTSEYEPAAPFDFEYYDDRFTSPDDPNSEIEVYIPIKRKA